MKCIKCGVTVAENQVFCADCLAVMERYPVKPNIQVTLPVRPAASAAKRRSRRHRAPVQDEQVRRLKFKLRLAHTALIVVLLAFFVLAGFVVRMLSSSGSAYAPGQNYSTMPSTEPT